MVKHVKPTTRRALELLKSREWVHGEALREVAGSRYGARLDELKPLGYSWEKKRIKGYAVPFYHLVIEDVAPGQIPLPLVAA